MLLASQVAGADQVELMDVIGLSDFQSWVRGAARAVGGFVNQALLFEDTVDGPDRRQGLTPPIA